MYYSVQLRSDLVYSTYSLKTMAAASKVKQHTEETSRRVRHVSQGWVERERLLSQCVQGNSVQLDCQKVRLWTLISTTKFFYKLLLQL